MSQYLSEFRVRYIGYWVAGRRNGPGLCHWHSGSHFSGTCYSPAYLTIAGNFVDDQICGEGTFTWKNGDKYEGTTVTADASKRYQVVLTKMEKSRERASSLGLAEILTKVTGNKIREKERANSAGTTATYTKENGRETEKWATACWYGITAICLRYYYSRMPKLTRVGKLEEWTKGYRKDHRERVWSRHPWGFLG